MKAYEKSESLEENEKCCRVLVMVAAPPASGKSFIGKEIARQFSDCAYMDLDSLNVLSERICAVKGEPFDKESDFFRENGREYEYAALFSFAWDMLKFCHVVILTAPFTREMWESDRFEAISRKARARGAKVIPVWVLSDEKVCRKNMFRRNAPRDKWKRANFADFVNGIHFERPALVPEEYQVDNRGRESWRADVQRIAGIIREITEA